MTARTWLGWAALGKGAGGSGPGKSCPAVPFSRHRRFRNNRLHRSGFPTLPGNGYTSTWWLGLWTSTSN